jgi:hypothetical protein
MLYFTYGSAFIHFAKSMLEYRQRDFIGSAGRHKMLRRQKHANLIPRQTCANAVWVLHFLVWQEVEADCIFLPGAHKGLT